MRVDGVEGERRGPGREGVSEQFQEIVGLQRLELRQLLGIAQESCGVRTGEQMLIEALGKIPRVLGKGCPQGANVLAVRTPGLDEKDFLIASDPEKYFTEPHYNGYPAVLVRLANIEPDELEELLTEAWRCMAPKALVKEFDADRRPQAD